MRREVKGSHSTSEAITGITRYYMGGGRFSPANPLYSRVYERLYLGGAPRTDKDVKELQQLNINAVISVQMDYELNRDPKEYNAAEHLVLRVPDTFCPDERQYETAMAFIRKNMNSGRSVFVHCNHGHGRSVAIILRFLQEHNQMKPDIACKLLSKRRSNINCKCALKHKSR